MKRRKEISRRAKNLERRNAAWWAKIYKQPEWRSVDQNLEAARRAYEAGNPLGLIDTTIYCDQLADHVPLPRWALHALAEEKIALLRGEKPARRKGRLADDLTKYRQRAIDYYRYEAVLDSRKHPENRKFDEDTYDHALRLCRGTFAGDVKRVGIKKSYQRVSKALRDPQGAREYYGSMYERFYRGRRK